MMCCEICKRTPWGDAIALIRQNAKGIDGVWRCTDHNLLPVDPQVKEITDIIQADNERKKA